jgi:hypothetical protein
MNIIRCAAEIGETSGGRITIVSSNSGANKVSNSLRVRDNGSSEESGKFRRLGTGPKLLCSESIVDVL